MSLIGCRRKPPSAALNTVAEGILVTQFIYKVSAVTIGTQRQKKGKKLVCVAPRANTSNKGSSFIVRLRIEKVHKKCRIHDHEVVNKEQRQWWV